MANASAGLITLGLKIGSKILFSLAKVVKVGKGGLAITSMAAYSYLFTWQFALMVMVSLFVHESGHIWAMKKCGLKTKGIYFIPFMGAAAVSEEMFKSRRDEVFIAIMGPIWGFLLAIVMLMVYIFTGDPMYAAVAGWMGMINLFNLLPINPLDGGRIMKSITFSLNSKLGLVFLFFGLLLSTLIMIWFGIWLFAILIVLGALELVYARHYNIPALSKSGIITSIVAYIVIVSVLWNVMLYVSHVPEAEIAKQMFMGLIT